MLLLNLTKKLKVMMAIIILSVLAGCELTAEDVVDISDQKQLLEIALGTYAPDIKKAAVTTIFDEDVLTEFAMRNSDDTLHKSAIKQINKIELLEKIALKASHNNSRLAALERLETKINQVSNKEVFLDIALHSKTKRVWRTAINGLRTPGFIIQLLENKSLNYEKRQYVEYKIENLMKKIEDEKQVARIWHVTKIGNRFAGVVSKKIIGMLQKGEIKDQTFLRQIIKSGWSGRMQILAEGVMKRDVLEIDDQAKLLEITQNENLPFLRSTAVSKIKDTEAIKKIALTDAHPGVRKSAIIKLENPAVLISIAQTDPVFLVRKAAAKTLLRRNQPNIPYSDGLALSIKTMLLDKIIIEHYGRLQLNVSQSWKFVRYKLGNVVRVEKLDIKIFDLDGQEIITEKLSGAEAKYEEIFKDGRPNVNRVRFDFLRFCKKLLKPLNKDQLKSLLSTTRNCKP
ncbi:hypothetical protein NBRC116602_26890 [Hyphomicrobiales bacterium 4NK60-0047b]